MLRSFQQGTHPVPFDDGVTVQSLYPAISSGTGFIDPRSLRLTWATTAFATVLRDSIALGGHGWLFQAIAVVKLSLLPRQEIPTVQIVAGIAVFSIPRCIAVVSKVIPSSGSF